MTAVARQTIGVLGGMGPTATVDFFAKVIAATPAERDQDHIHILVDCNPQVPDRTAFLQSEGPDPRPVLVAMAKRLEWSGASFLVMACNTAHAFGDHIRAAVAIPLVDWPSVVADALSVAGVERVGILATTGTIYADIYRTPLQARGLQYVVPTTSSQAEVMRAVYGTDGIKSLGPHSPVARRELSAAAEDIVRRGADAILLACTEFSTVHAAAKLDVGAPVFDAAEIVARHVAQRALGLPVPNEAPG